MVNVQYDWPMTNYQISKVLESEYDDAYSEIDHYETIKIGQYAAGLRVDETFYNAQHKVNIDGTISIKNGNEICGPVTVAENFYRENETEAKDSLLEMKQEFEADIKTLAATKAQKATELAQKRDEFVTDFGSTEDFSLEVDFEHDSPVWGEEA